MKDTPLFALASLPLTGVTSVFDSARREKTSTSPGDSPEYEFRPNGEHNPDTQGAQI